MMECTSGKWEVAIIIKKKVVPSPVCSPLAAKTKSDFDHRKKRENLIENSSSVNTV